MVLSNYLKQCSEVLEACNDTHFLFFHLNFHLDASGTVYHQFGLLSTYFHLLTCAGYVETFN